MTTKIHVSPIAQDLVNSNHTTADTQHSSHFYRHERRSSNWHLRGLSSYTTVAAGIVCLFIGILGTQSALLLFNLAYPSAPFTLSRHHKIHTDTSTTYLHNKDSSTVHEKSTDKSFDLFDNTIVQNNGDGLDKTAAAAGSLRGSADEWDHTMKGTVVGNVNVPTKSSANNHRGAPTTDETTTSPNLSTKSKTGGSTSLETNRIGINGAISEARFTRGALECQHVHGRFKEPLSRLVNRVSIPWSSTLNPVSWAPSAGTACDGFFGNGYTDTLDIVTDMYATKPFTSDIVGGQSTEELSTPIQLPKKNGEKSPIMPIQCAQHGRTKDSYCIVRNFIINTRKIQSSCGAEAIDSVSGRSERTEFPNPTAGAFQVYVSSGLEEGTLPSANVIKSITKHRNSVILRSLEATHAPNCDVVITTPVLLVTRFEYANLALTTTDWYNVWMVSQILNLPRVPVIFMDGHSLSPMNDVWNSVFPSVSHVKHLDGRICFREAIFVPNGYTSPLTAGVGPMRRCKASPHVFAFSQMFRNAMNIQPPSRSTCSKERKTIVFARRVNYLAHPRHTGKVNPRIANEQALFEALEVFGQRFEQQYGTKVEIKNGLFTEMTVQEQIEMVQDACVFLGAHGAALAHVLFQPVGSVLLEIQTPGFQRGRFEAYAQWADVSYVKWVARSSTINVEKAVQIVEQILLGQTAQGTIQTMRGPPMPV